MNRQFKRTTAFLAALIMTAALPLSVQKLSWVQDPVAAYADDEESYTDGEINGIQYQKYSDHIVISGESMDAAEITIPAEIDGLPVTEIGTNVGGFCAVSTLKLPDSLRKIGSYAFNWCENLTSVTLPSNLEEIDFQAFEYCKSLTEVVFPPQLIKTSCRTFDETPWLEAQRKKDPLVIINGALIDARTAKGDVTIPKDVKYVASGAFYQNNDVTSVVFPSSVSQIPDNMFWYCENLTSVEFKGASDLAWGAFAACNKLKEIKLSGKLKTINSGAFTDNESTATITFYGTEEAWNKVEKDPDDAFLKRAAIVFDPNGGEDDDETVTGDLNKDGKCDQTDARLLLDWLLTKEVTLEDWQAGDLSGDETLTATDLTLLKQLILAG